MARDTATATTPATVSTASSAKRWAGRGSAAPAPYSTAVVVASLVVAAFFVAFGALHYGFYTHGLLADTPVYERYGDAIVHGAQVPYRDFGVEYPPLALPVFAAPSVAAGRGDFTRYRELFELLMLLCGGAASALVGVVLARQGAVRARLVAGTLLAGLSPLALGPVVLSRFDLWPALLTIAGVAAVVSGRARLAAGLLGAAVAAKLYPAVVLPLALAYVWRRHGRREAVVCTGIAGGVLALCVVPFVALSPHGVWASVSGQASRPLQIESLGAALLLGAHQAWGVALTQISSHGSDNLAGAVPNRLAAVQSLLAALTIIALWIAFARGEAQRDRLLRYCAAAVCAFVALGKVLSPQYLIWLIALVPLVRGRRGAAASGLFVAAMILTQLWFPHRYLDLAYGFDARASWFVLARDLVLVALLGVLAWPSGRAPRTAVATLGTVVALAAGATVAAAAGVSSPAALAHTRVLVETGAPSGCRTRKPTPPLAPGTVRYAVTGYENTSARRRCVTVMLRAPAHEQLFSAAYGNGFYPVDAGRNYLGDGGTCTNVAQHRSATLVYSFRIPARTRYAIEVEQCNSNRSAPRYGLRVSTR